MKNAICLIVDGLHIGFVGAYGNSWITTPAMDRLASESALFDRHYINSLDTSLICRAYWYGLHPEFLPTDEMPDFTGLPSSLLEKGYRTILLTDDSDIAHNLFADGFSEVHLIETPSDEKPASTLEDTQFFRLFATIIDLVSSSDKPYFLWCHFRGFAGPWDFPMDSRLQYVEEGDPLPYPKTTPPKIVLKTETVEIEDADPDVLQSISEAYSGGITAFDESLDCFMDSFRENNSFGETLCVLTSFRGFSMGEHRIIGPPDAWYQTEKRSLLYSENVHIPLLIRYPSGFGAMTRTSSLTQTGDVFETLCEWFGVDVHKPSQSLTVLISETTEVLRDKIEIIGPGDKAVASSEWFAKQLKDEMRIELYAKPDDRFEVNEVADRCEGVAESLLGDMDPER